MLVPMEAVRRLLDLRHRGRAEDLPAVLADAAPLLDAEAATVLLVDYGQSMLCPLRGTDPGAAQPLPVENTPAGRAFVRPGKPGGTRATAAGCGCRCCTGPSGSACSNCG